MPLTHNQPMKVIAQILLFSASFALSPVLCAQAKKKEAAPMAEATKAADISKPVSKDEDTNKKADRPLPMHSRVDEIDAAGKTFTQNTRDGRKVKHVITPKTDIKQGGGTAKFEDIKAGDMVSGSRIKKNPEGTEYEVVKITKFGPKAKDADKDEKK